MRAIYFFDITLVYTNSISEANWICGLFIKSDMNANKLFWERMNGHAYGKGVYAME